MDPNLAYTLGINPVAGGAMGTVQDLSSMTPTARYPVDLYLPCFDIGLHVDVYFTTLQNSGLEWIAEPPGIPGSIHPRDVLSWRPVRAGAPVARDSARPSRHPTYPSPTPTRLSPMTNTPPTPATLAKDLESYWLGFIDTFEPWRPALYRFCRSLTRTPWDAEDLVQEALMRAFSTMGGMTPPRNPRAWLFRVASNLWIDRQRKKRELLVEELPEAAAEDPPVAARDAGAKSSWAPSRHRSVSPSC